MKDFLKHHGLWVLFAAAVISVALAVLSVYSNTSSPLSNVVGVIASPFRAAYTAIADWIERSLARLNRHGLHNTRRQRLRNRCQ